MKTLPQLFEQNRSWAERIKENEPDFFQILSREQKPGFLWIGCSDSRVPANQIIDMQPGDLFVHRNIANMVVHTDLNCLSVLQYAVEALQVKHIIVCGHYGCGGVGAALEDKPLGLIDHWLRHIQDVARTHDDILSAITTFEQRRDALCALNVISQVANVCRTSTVREAWENGQSLSVHSWIFEMHNGLLQDLGMQVNKPDEIDSCFSRAVAQVRKKFLGEG